MGDDFWTAAWNVLEGLYVENVEPLWGEIVSSLHDEPLENVLMLHAVVDAENAINAGREPFGVYKSRVYQPRDRDIERIEIAELLVSLETRYRR